MKRQLFWIVELFVWFLILCVLSGGILLAHHLYRKQFNTYQIFLPDVDGLIKGSPVKLMGIQIGHVNQINIVGEDVYVRFIITDKKVAIPRGSVVTVEFSGLGGSKSLEIYPPSEKNKIPSDNILIAQNPKRIGDSLGVLNTMFEDVLDIAYTIFSFMNKLGIIEKVEQAKIGETFPVDKKYDPEEMLKISDEWLENAEKQRQKYSKTIKKIKRETNFEQR